LRASVIIQHIVIEWDKSSVGLPAHSRGTEFRTGIPYPAMCVAWLAANR
jgi:hypothetical protein